MTNTHPYISGPGNVSQMVAHLRRSFPAVINSETVKKLGLAPNNESYVINVLHFIGVIDSEGKKTPEASKIFSQHKDEEFAKDFGALVEKAYSSLFELHGAGAWKLHSDDLITFFRNSDQTSATIGGRQAGTFRVLAGLSGQTDISEGKPKKPAKPPGSEQRKQTEAKKLPSPPASEPTIQQKEVGSAFGLTVRVEINLPADGSKETYDNIFRSIKENLLGG